MDAEAVQLLYWKCTLATWTAEALEWLDEETRNTNHNWARNSHKRVCYYAQVGPKIVLAGYATLFIQMYPTLLQR